MVKLHQSALGPLLLYDDDEPPVLTGGLPTFHRSEVAILRGAPQDLWAAVIQAKGVFAGARVVEYDDPGANRRRFERRLKRRGGWEAWQRELSTDGKPPDPDDDSAE